MKYDLPFSAKQTLAETLTTPRLQTRQNYQHGLPVADLGGGGEPAPPPPPPLGDRLTPSFTVMLANAKF